jgi:hypothetical protein
MRSGPDRKVIDFWFEMVTRLKTEKLKFSSFVERERERERESEKGREREGGKVREREREKGRERDTLILHDSSRIDQLRETETDRQTDTQKDRYRHKRERESYIKSTRPDP